MDDDTRGTRDNRDTQSRDTQSLASKWTAGETSSQQSLEDESSTSFFQYQNNHLQLKQKKETPSSRPIIPASKNERLSFYRAYLCSPSRKQLLVMQNVRFNVFLWNHVLNAFFKNLPHTFVHIFLASYVPEEHIFLPKMVPISNGYKYSLIFTAFMELLTFIDITIMLMSYTASSIFLKNPWNHCEATNSTDKMEKYTINCYTKTDFIEKFVNDTPVFRGLSYISSDNESFQLSHLVYHRVKRDHFVRDVSFCCFIWVAVALLHTKIYSKVFWKVLHRFQWIVNFLDILTLLYMTGVFFQNQVNKRKPVPVPIYPRTEMLWKADLGMLVESAISPPVIHILTARSTDRIKPSSDCTVIVVSNALCYLLRGLLLATIKKYIEDMFNAPLFYTESNRYSWFFLYTIFFSSFYLGDIYTMVFFSMYLITEIMVLIVTYHCIIETVINEWKKFKRWYVIIVMTVIGLILYTTTLRMTRYVLRVYAKAFVLFCEISFLYILYPLGRLVDDYTFHFGVRPAKLRILTMGLVPVFYSIKLYRLLTHFVNVMIISKVPSFPINFQWTWSLAVIPVLLGFIVVIYRYILVDRKSWKFIFRPVPHWGPKEFQTRQLRKQYDSREYIGSQYPRLLSRYLLKKGEAESYKLELRYDVGRRSTAFQDITFTNEKKQA